VRMMLLQPNPPLTCVRRSLGGSSSECCLADCGSQRPSSSLRPLSVNGA